MNLGWKILIAIALAAGIWLAGDKHGFEQATKEDALKLAAANEKAHDELEAANVKIRGLSLQMAHQLDRIADAGEKEKEDAKAHEDDLRAQLRSGALRLRLAVANCESAKAGNGNGAGSSRGIENQASAELLPATADDLASLVFDADAEVRRTNECIDRYETVKKSVNAQAQTADTTPDIGDHVDGK
jgi:hypothetical protein